MIIVGDIHSCANELEQIIKSNPNKQIISCGDTFDRGELGVKVWELIHEYNIKAVLGNHEYKLLQYLKGERDHLPWYYYVFLNNFVKKYDLNVLVNYLENLPLILPIDSNSLVTHGAVILDSPWTEDLFTNVFGRYPETSPVPENPKDGWWKLYDAKEGPFVYYGHVCFHKPNIRKNSLGLDTGACHGFGLTYHDTETKETITIQSKDYFSILKSNTKVKLEPDKIIVDYIKHHARRCNAETVKGLKKKSQET